MMNFEPTDIAIFMISFAACAYCFVLSRRLRALQNTKDGLGGTIMALSKSIATMTGTTQETRLRVQEMAGRLTGLLEEANSACDRIETLTRDMQTSHAVATQQAREAQTEWADSMRQTVEESKDRILEMNLLVRQMRSLSDTASGQLVEPPQSRSTGSY